MNLNAAQAKRGTTTRIACSPLSGRIFEGRINKDSNAFIGIKRDVTSDVLRAIVEKAEGHGGSFEIVGDDKKWVCTVSLATPPATVA